MPSKVWDEITYPFTNFNGCSVEVWEWISNSIPHFIMDLITYPCWREVGNSVFVLHSQTTPSAPVTLSGTPELGWAPLTCVCWQINSILTNIGHRNSIRILNHCPACRTTFIATRFRVAVICPIIPVPHCIRVFFYFVWFVFINHIFQFYYELCTYCNILDIYLS